MNYNKGNFNASRGSAVIYIIIAIALFGALTLILTRSNQRSDAQNLDKETIMLQTTKVLQVAATAKSVIDQMQMSGSQPTDLDFTVSSDAAFDTGPNMHKVFHPEGGGLTLSPDAQLFTGTGTNPDPGWYIGMFNNIEWTPTTDPDIVFTAYDIGQDVCKELNRRITGDTTIPVMGGAMKNYLIPDSLHNGVNADLDATVCADCDEKGSICVSNVGNTMWSYYNIIEAR